MSDRSTLHFQPYKGPDSQRGALVKLIIDWQLDTDPPHSGSFDDVLFSADFIGPETATDLIEELAGDAAAAAPDCSFWSWMEQGCHNVGTIYAYRPASGFWIGHCDQFGLPYLNIDDLDRFFVEDADPVDFAMTHERLRRAMGSIWLDECRASRKKEGSEHD